MQGSKTCSTTIPRLSRRPRYSVAETEKYLPGYGAGLFDQIDAPDDPAGFEAMLRLHAAFGRPFLDADAVADTLRTGR